MQKSDPSWNFKNELNWNQEKNEASLNTFYRNFRCPARNVTAVFYFQDFMFKKIYSKLGHQVPKFVIHKYAVMCLVAQLCPALCDPIDYRPPGSSIMKILHGVGRHPSSRRSSQPTNSTQVSHIAGRFFTIWATREDIHKTYTLIVEK